MLHIVNCIKSLELGITLIVSALPQPEKGPYVVQLDTLQVYPVFGVRCGTNRETGHAVKTKDDELEEVVDVANLVDGEEEAFPFSCRGPIFRAW